MESSELLKLLLEQEEDEEEQLDSESEESRERFFRSPSVATLPSAPLPSDCFANASS